MVIFIFRTLLVFSLLVASLQLGAMRPLLDEEQWLRKDKDLVVQSLQRGPVTGSGPNPCTNIPGRQNGHCNLGGMNVAGNVMHATPAFHSIVAGFGMASIAEGTQDQH